jgi:two-component system OmpR family response regulator
MGHRYDGTSTTKTLIVSMDAAVAGDGPRKDLSGLAGSVKRKSRGRLEPLLPRFIEASMRVLLVEDDHMVGAAVAQALKDAAYAVDWVTDGDAALDAAGAEAYDLVLLDLGLPAADGLEVLQRFRKICGQLPVIIVTARDGIENRIDGLDLGADDYLIKPFEVRELLARMRAILRRQGSGVSAILSNGVISLDPATHEARFGDETCRLTAREFALLQALLTRPGTIFSREDLERHIYGWNEEVESNAVEFLIHAVRKKTVATAIRNVRGVGWMVDRPS